MKPWRRESLLEKWYSAAYGIKPAKVWSPKQEQPNRRCKKKWQS